MHDLIVYIRGLLLIRYTCNCRCKVVKYFVFCMRGSRGGAGSGPPLPPEICQRWGLVWIFDEYERGFKGCFYLIFIFFLARSARQYSKHCKYLKNPNHFHVQRVIPSPVIHTIPVFHESAICLKLHDFTPFQPKIFWGRTPHTTLL